MLQPTTPATARPDALPRIWPHLQPVLLVVVATCRQRRTAERLPTLTVGLLQALGRHTITRVLQGLGQGNADWSAVYRLFSQARFDLAAGRQALLTQVLDLIPVTRPLVWSARSWLKKAAPQPPPEMKKQRKSQLKRRRLTSLRPLPPLVRPRLAP